MVEVLGQREEQVEMTREGGRTRRTEVDEEQCEEESQEGDEPGERAGHAPALTSKGNNGREETAARGKSCPLSYELGSSRRVWGSLTGERNGQC